MTVTIPQAQRLTMSLDESGEHDPFLTHAILAYGAEVDPEYVEEIAFGPLRQRAHDLAAALELPLALLSTLAIEGDEPEGSRIFVGIVLATNRAGTFPTQLSADLFATDHQEALSGAIERLELTTHGEHGFYLIPSNWGGGSITAGTWSEDLQDELDALAEDGEDPQQYLQEEHEWEEGDVEGEDIVLTSSEDTEPGLRVTADMISAIDDAEDHVYLVGYNI